MRHLAIAAGFSVMLLEGGCVGVPQMVIQRDMTPIEHSANGETTRIPTTVSDAAPAGPKVATLVNNMRCELLEAANSEVELPKYVHDAGGLHANNSANADGIPSRVYNLRNIFSNVEYVAQAQFTLDVTATSSFNPTLGFSNTWRASTPILPATGALLSVAGQLSESPHRYIQINDSVDFGRLVGSGSIFNKHAERDSAPAAKAGALLTWPGKIQTVAMETPVVAPTEEDFLQAGCANAGAGGELAGKLGLQEVLATGLIAATSSDVAVFARGAGGAGGLQISGVAPSIAVSSNNTFGLISSQIDFTIVQNVNAGPTWTLHYFKGPGGASAGLINLNRQVKDQLLITFVPVCVKSRYIDYVDSQPGSAPYEYRMDYGKIRIAADGPPDGTGRIKTKPTGASALPDGTPGWVNYLPLCKGAAQIADLNALRGQTDQFGQPLMPDKAYGVWLKALGQADAGATSNVVAQGNGGGSAATGADLAAAVEQAKSINSLLQLGVTAQSGLAGP